MKKKNPNDMTGRNNKARKSEIAILRERVRAGWRFHDKQIAELKKRIKKLERKK